MSDIFLRENERHAIMENTMTVGSTDVPLIIQWAHKTRIEAALLELVLDGSLKVGWQNGGPVFQGNKEGEEDA
jgi:hypothetical protein